MSCSNSNTLYIGRPTQQQYNQLCNNSVNSTTGTGCFANNNICGSKTGSHDRNLTPRRYREKVREDIKDHVLLMLGAPQVKIELDDQQLDHAVDQSLKIFEEYAGREYFDYYVFESSPGKSVYKLPDEIGMVRNVYYMEDGSVLPFSAQQLGGVLPLPYLYPGATQSFMSNMYSATQPVWGNAGQFLAMKQYETMYSKISSQIGGWEWVSDMRHIKLYPIPCGNRKVIVHYIQKCKDWTEVKQGMQEGALAYAMIMLGNVRGKFTNIPGPGGGTVLDGEYMRQKGWELKEKWQEDLIYRYGDLPMITWG